MATTSPLAWLNLALYALQLVANRQWARDIGPMSRRYETLLTPAPYAFSVWGFIYTCVAVPVVVDCFWPAASVYANAPNATVLRALFALSCLMNGLWLVLFTNDAVNAATVALLVLWFALFVLYAHVVTERRDAGADLWRFVRNELGLTVYFAWTCGATLISFAVTAQDVAGGFLSLTSYVTLLSLLVVAALSAVVYAGDVTFGLVAVWTLVGLAVKRTTFEPRVELIATNVRACAAQSAALVTAFIVISLVHKLLAPAMQSQSMPPSGAPLYSAKPMQHVDYGTTNA
ncbi:unnamed protein product [Hyaloperonospora brassicae]|uniref:Transmembrane protein n=1 Tax=Hyaloperonospora brassicae TaxID=162125 RepID=A0AAV0V6B4_HYABA|nr:unnamed protein product [Hyaloperonospora brassicae]